VSSIADAWDSYCAARRRAFEWRADLSVASSVGLAFGMAALTGLMAQLRVPLPGTPVPVTGQTLAVLLAGVLLGARYGFLSQAIYVGLGCAGLPWFTGFSGGIAWLLRGVTGGYLVGFVVAAGFVGHVTQRSAASRRFPWQLVLMLAGSAVILACGALHYSLTLHTGLGATLSAAVVPFIPGDVCKSILAASASTLLLPKE
jgi:biotin transport system substrate-specific component